MLVLGGGGGEGDVQLGALLGVGYGGEGDAEVGDGAPEVWREGRLAVMVLVGEVRLRRKVGGTRPPHG